MECAGKFIASQWTVLFELQDLDKAQFTHNSVLAQSVPSSHPIRVAAVAIPHTYRYAVPSSIAPQFGLAFSTSGGTHECPYFFQGQVRQPRIVALALRALSRVVGSRFHLPAAMLQRILAQSDPVVTCGGDWLRFEGFSACCSAYARVDLSPESYRGVIVGHGTTNVDFNAPFRAALAQIRDGEDVGFAIGHEDVTMLRNTVQFTERKVALPMRWVKGFCEVQAFQAQMQLVHRIGRFETLAFLRSLPASTQAKSEFWVVPTSRGLRISQTRASNAVRLAGLERLRLLQELAPDAVGLSVWSNARQSASEWVLDFGAMRFHLTLSAEVWRGFSGEGQVLEQLGARLDDSLLQHVQGMFKWQAELRPEEFADNWDQPIELIARAIATLASRGLAGFDVIRGASFHRELPFDLALVDALHPRLIAAKKIVGAQGVRIAQNTPARLEAEVQGSDVKHLVTIEGGQSRCTCPWYAKHRNERGPCKHLLAVRLWMEPDDL